MNPKAERREKRARARETRKRNEGGRFARGREPRRVAPNDDDESSIIKQQRAGNRNITRSLAGVTAAEMGKVSGRGGRERRQGTGGLMRSARRRLIDRVIDRPARFSRARAHYTHPGEGCAFELFNSARGVERTCFAEFLHPPTPPPRRDESLPWKVLTRK